MDPVALAGLAGLALVDSTSFGTLGLPVVMLIQPQLRVRTYAVYVATISTFYLALGVLLLLGIDALSGPWAQAATHPVTLWATLVVGVALVGGSFLIDGGAVRRRSARRAARGLPPRSPRRDRWIGALAGPDSRASTAAAVALVAGLVEAASMLPYLAALGVISTAGVGPVVAVAVLTAYVAVMALPAGVLLVSRLAFARRLQPILERIDRWLRRWSADAVAWVVGIVGFLLAREALDQLITQGVIPWGG